MEMNLLPKIMIMKPKNQYRIKLKQIQFVLSVAFYLIITFLRINDKKLPPTNPIVIDKPINTPILSFKSSVDSFLDSLLTCVGPLIKQIALPQPLVQAMKAKMMK